jgi:uncharacterized protein YhbP (UPF0306 family)
MDHEAVAAEILRSNRYLTLATADKDGAPWAAPLAYVIDRNGDLLYYSAIETRHGRHIRENPLAACAVFDSSRSSDEVDGVQFSAQVSEVLEDDLFIAMELYFERAFPDPTVRSHWMRPVGDFVGDAPQRFYRIRIVEISKPDPASVKIDRRIQLDTSRVRALLASR